MIRQLRYSGVIDALRVRRMGFPVCIPFVEFFKNFKCVSSDAVRVRVDVEGYRLGCEFIVKAVSLNSEAIQLGKSKV